MLSVLICSANNALLAQVKASIEKTIGVPFEILHFNNGVHKKGICQVYNELAVTARFPVLCFLHEDVIFNTVNWGSALLHLFSTDNSIGLIGVAGSKYKSRFLSGWYCNNTQLDCANVVHRMNGVDEKMYFSPGNTGKPEEVVCIDGVFMCCRKDVWESIRFNEALLPGYHFYDIDFSLRAAFRYQVMVTYNVNIIHLTGGGDYGNNWIETAFAFRRFYRHALPFGLTDYLPVHTDKLIIKTWLDFLKNYSILFRYKIRWVTVQRLYADPRLYYAILKFFLYRPLGLKRIHYLFKAR